MLLLAGLCGIPDGNERPSHSARAGKVSFIEWQARKAQEEADRLFIAAWNARMLWLRGPTEPSPTLGAALKQRYYFLWVGCQRCRTTAVVDLQSIKRPPEMRLGALEPSLRCKPCKRDGGHPRAAIERLSRSRDE
jgi:hypothetical protein